MTAAQALSRPSLQARASGPRAVGGLGHVHFVGIGGAGMSGIARILRARGVPVSGSDAKESATLTALRALGAEVSVGHDAANLGEADTVVVSSAIRSSNPELVEAVRRGLPVLPRAAALAAVMSGRRGIAVAGTHGKTTTTSMLAVALRHCGADPSFAIGGDLAESGANAHDGSGALFVAEADESDGSFLLLSPEVAVVTNVESDHLDHYGSLDAVEKAFVDFVDRIPPGGFLVACLDDPGARALARLARERGTDVRTYGTAPDADVRMVDVATVAGRVSFRLVDRGARRGPVTLRLPGLHNALNATAAYAAAVGVGFPSDDVLAGLAAFAGTRRRFELKGAARGIRVYDDYAHHPTEVVAALRAARDVATPGRLVACFQPHLYSRTKAFAPDFGRALGLADDVVVMEVFGAREDPVPGVSGELVASAVPLPPERVSYQPVFAEVAADLVSRARAGDLVITIGAGDVTWVGPEVIALLTGAQTP